MRFDNYLNANGTDEATTVDSVQLQCGLIFKSVSQTMEVLTKEAFTVLRKFIYVKSHSIVGRTLSINLQNETQGSYSFLISLLDQYFYKFTHKQILPTTKHFADTMNGDIRKKNFTLFSSEPTTFTDANVFALHYIFMQICLWPTDKSNHKFLLYIACSAI